MENSVDLSTLNDYLSDGSVSLRDKRVVYNLSNILVKTKYNIDDKLLNDIEKDIYFFDGDYIGDLDRIIIELEKIMDSYAYQSAKGTDIEQRVNALLQIINTEKPTRGIIAYLKKRILELQIILGLDITFYSVIEELYAEKLASLKLGR